MNYENSNYVFEYDHHGHQGRRPALLMTPPSTTDESSWHRHNNQSKINLQYVWNDGELFFYRDSFVNPYFPHYFVVKNQCFTTADQFVKSQIERWMNDMSINKMISQYSIDEDIYSAFASYRDLVVVRALAAILQLLFRETGVLSKYKHYGFSQARSINYDGGREYASNVIFPDIPAKFDVVGKALEAVLWGNGIEEIEITRTAAITADIHMKLGISRHYQQWLNDTCNNFIYRNHRDKELFAEYQHATNKNFFRNASEITPTNI